MKVTHKQIKYLGGYYNILSSEEKTVEVLREIPFETGIFTDKFPKYLKGYKKYYKKQYCGYCLKPQFISNRPLYAIVITYHLYDIELTESGRVEVQKRYEIHKRNMERYASLLS